MLATLFFQGQPFGSSARCPLGPREITAPMLGVNWPHVLEGGLARKNRTPNLMKTLQQTQQHAQQTLLRRDRLARWLSVRAGSRQAAAPVLSAARPRPLGSRSWRRGSGNSSPELSKRLPQHDFLKPF